MFKSELPKLDFVGVGAARAGSTWLAKCLWEHPGVYVPARKELHFFDKNRFFRSNEKVNQRGRRVLSKHFRGADPQCVSGEITPRYMINESALRRIAVNFEGVKIITIFRDPVERAFSQYRYFKNNKKKENCKEFELALTGVFYEDYVVKSIYAPIVKNIYKIFEKEKILFLLYDDIKQQPREVMNRVCEFLELDRSFSPYAVDRFVNYSFSEEEVGNMKDGAGLNKEQFLYEVESGVAREQCDLGRETRMRIYERFFKEDVLELELLLEADLSAWKP